MDQSDELMYSRDQVLPDESRGALASAVKRRVSIRVARGVYFDADEWDLLDPRERYRLKVIGVARTRKGAPVISHWSAAAIWGFPSVGSWPDTVHFTVAPATGGRSRDGVVKHPASLSMEDVVEFRGLRITRPCRTVLDLAGSATFASAVACADFLLHRDRRGNLPPLGSREELDAAWQRMGPVRAHARIRAVSAFADPRADSPLESISRVMMRKIGVPRPELQTSYYDAAGFIGETDFSWPAFGVVGEADGDIKYLDPRFRAGKSADQVVLDEKRREDRLRALPRVVVRWPWAVASSPQLLRARLVGAGLPTGQRW